MTNEILTQLKALEREGRTRLAEIRRIKRESRPPKSPSQRMSSFIKARRQVGYDTELNMIVALLDRSDLTKSERHSLKLRKKVVLERINLTSTS
jgi:hypothetical protein